MKQRGDVLTFSATDLSDALGCEHLSQLEHQVEVNGLERPKPRDPMLAMLAKRGQAHERAYLEHLRGKGLEVVEARMNVAPTEGMEELRQLMHAGVPAIYQATLADERGVWSGRADFLLRVERPTRSLGAYGYEVVDTKLARDTRAGAILQLCLYSDLVGQLQGELPENMYIVTPVNGFTEQPFRVADFMAYYRRSRAALIERLGSGAPSYPEPVERCDVCRFWEGCEARWRRDDHLSLVADISRAQRAELVDQAIHTLQAFAEAPQPLPFMPKRGSRESLARVHKQAQLQLRGRLAKKLVHELVRPIEPGRGLCDLPEPSTGDLFLDLEGDPFNGTQGLEYLFGWVGVEGGAWRYELAWARDALEERHAFERFMQAAMVRLEADAGMHIYHYGAYEQSAFKRLSTRYGSHAEDLDVLLRGHRFVNLLTIVKQSVVASVESYSIKRLEPLIGFVRQVELADVGSHKRGLEGLLQLGARELPSEAMEVVRAYNEDDCRAAQALRDWLERERSAVIAEGTTVPRPTTPEADAPESAAAWLAKIKPFEDALLNGLPVEGRDEAQQARWLLGHMLRWHKREENCSWWERFRLRKLEHEELVREPGAITGLRFEGDSPPDLYDVKKSRGVRFSFPVQQLEVRRGDELLRCVAVGKAAFPNLGEVLGIDASAGWVDVKVSMNCDPDAVANEGRVIRDDLVSNKALGETIAEIAEQAIADGLDVAVSHPLAAKLLMRVPMPKLPLSLPHPWELVHHLQGDVLPVQGPPGAGKSYAGARMIVLLHHAGKKVGVTANSHAVIENLMRALPAAAAELGVGAPQMMRVHREGKGDDILPIRPKDKALKAFNEGKVDVLGGTAWFWASPAARDLVHTLVIDEAGQMSLPNAVACSPAARNFILLGDPQQLAQPIQASHPEGLEVSALQHLIGAEQTLPPNRGLFLERTFRMHPDVCELISKLYYGGLLGSEPELKHQRVEGVNGLSGSGLRLVQVPHEGNTNRSVEEVEHVVDLVNRLVQDGEYVDSKQSRRPLTWSDILIVAPFNAQVHALRERLPGMSIGTVDRFQGQEAPVVIYGMTTSSAEDAPRGMGFLYDSHRFNVAISRARALAILVVSPALLYPRVKSPEQMRLANALAHYVELAKSS